MTPSKPRGSGELPSHAPAAWESGAFGTFPVEKYIFPLLFSKQQTQTNICKEMLY